MDFIKENIVFIITLIAGGLFSCVMSIIRSQTKTQRISTECQNELLHLIGKYMTLVSFVAFMLNISGEITKEKLLQFGIVMLISIIGAKIHCYYHFDILKKIKKEDTDINTLKESFIDEPELKAASFFMLIWIFFTAIETMAAYVCAFYGFKKMVAVIAVSAIIFTAESFFGIAFIDLINQLIRKVKDIIHN